MSWDGSNLPYPSFWKWMMGEVSQGNLADVVFIHGFLGDHWVGRRLGGPESNGFDIFTIKLAINWEQIRHFYINAYEKGGGVNG